MCSGWCFWTYFTAFANLVVAIIFIASAAITQGAMVESKIVGEEFAAGFIITLLTSLSVFIYSIVHVCCCQTVRGSKRHIFLSILSVAWYVCAIGAMYGSEDSWIEAQCSQKVDCHHVDSFMDDCNAGAKLCHHPKVDRNSLPGEGQYYASWFLDDCWVHGGDDDICRVFETQEDCMKFSNHATKTCDGITHSNAWEFSMLFTALPSILCTLFLLVGIFLSWKASMSPLNMKDIEKYRTAAPSAP